MGSKILTQDHVKQILDLFSSGKILEAVDSINTTLNNYPEEPILFNILGACYAELGDSSKAIKNYESAIGLDKNYAKAYYNLAGTLHETKQYDEAIEAYKKAINIEPENKEALNNLGNTLRELQKPQEAIEFFQRAIDINPNYTESLYGLALSNQDLGLSDEAIKIYEKVLILKPNFYELHNNIAIIFQNLDRIDSAIHHLNEAILINPNFTEAHHNLGSVFREQGEFSKAYNCFELALNIDPSYFEAYRSLGNLQMEMGELESSINSYKKVLEIKPDYIEVLNNLGSVYKDISDFDASLDAFEKALDINPNYLEVLNNLGLTFIELGRYDEAIETYERAIDINPNYSYSFNNLGITLNRIHKYEQAENCFIQAIRINPNYFDANLNYGNLLFQMDRYAEAIHYYEISLGIRPSESLYIFGDIFHANMQICNWEDWSKNTSLLKNKISNEKKVIGPFALTALVDNPMLIRKATEKYIKDKYPKSKFLPNITNHPKHKKIRIGYFSADFREHPVSALTVELYERHSREEFEVYAFSFGPDTNDPVNLRIKSGVDYFYDIRSMHDKDAVSLVRSFEIDIAVDLGGFTQDARTEIFAHSVAPIQLSYIGYLGTMGAEYYDYLIADSIIIPEESQKNYTEKIVYLPTYQVNDSSQYDSVSSLARKDYGLPEEGFVFCCFNKTYKYNPKCFDAWARILKKVKNSVLLIYADEVLAKANLKNEISQRGIDPDRLIFGKHLSKPEYLGRYKVADLFLDTNPYNAGATSSDALRMGLPVLTYPGKSFSSRMGSSLLNAVNMPELVASSEKEYELMAIELANNPIKLKTIKDKLLKNLSEADLYNSNQFTKNIESAFKLMYDRYHKGIDPDHIYIQS